MIFELLNAPFPEGYGEAIISLDACKEHLRADGDDEDFLIGALRDASIDFVERYCSVKLGPAEGLTWTTAAFLRDPRSALPLCVSPITAMTSISWLDRSSSVIEGASADFRYTADGRVLPKAGGTWPRGGADVRVEFTAGFAAGEAPLSLLAAVRLFLGHLYKNREAVTDRGTEAEVPFGVRQLCAPFRPVLI